MNKVVGKGEAAAEGAADAAEEGAAKVRFVSHFPIYSLIVS